MAVAIRAARWEEVEGVSSLFTMIEFLYIALCAWLAVAGAGPLSIDALLARWRPRQTQSLHRGGAEARRNSGGRDGAIVHAS
jgi:hypothetical protein